MGSEAAEPRIRRNPLPASPCIRRGRSEPFPVHRGGLGGVASAPRSASAAGQPLWIGRRPASEVTSAPGAAPPALHACAPAHAGQTHRFALESLESLHGLLHRRGDRHLGANPRAQRRRTRRIPLHRERILPRARRRGRATEHDLVDPAQALLARRDRQRAGESLADRVVGATERFVQRTYPFARLLQQRMRLPLALERRRHAHRPLLQFSAATCGGEDVLPRRLAGVAPDGVHKVVAITRVDRLTARGIGAVA